MVKKIIKAKTISRKTKDVKPAPSDEKSVFKKSSLTKASIGSKTISSLKKTKIIKPKKTEKPSIFKKKKVVSKKQPIEAELKVKTAPKPAVEPIAAVKKPETQRQTDLHLEVDKKAQSAIAEAPSPLPAATSEAAVPQKAKPKIEREIPTAVKIAPALVERPPEAPKPQAEPLSPPPIKKETEKIIEIDIPITVKELALNIGEKPAVLIKKLIDHKIIANLNFPLDEELVRKIALEYGFQIKKKPTEEELLFKEHEAVDAAKLKPRPPIVTFMGHVDHGKTSLLDVIRKSKVADSEYGGITQHIGAYSVSLPNGKITFLDTPGHEAFTAMRARGVKVADIAVLVVAADDGVMPQTIEAIDHAKEADVPIIVAINKIDRPQVNIDAVKKELSKLGLTPEEWGGKTITVNVSAKTGQGIDDLLGMIILEAEMLELKADPTSPASGIVLDAKVSEGRGTVVTLLVKNGTLRAQEGIIIGPYYAKIRALFNEFGKHIEEAAPSASVEILGLSGLPGAGEKFFVISDEKKAKELAARRKMQLREKELRPIKIMSLEDLSGQIKEGKVKELKLILKADVSGSLEAINEAFKKIASSEIKLNIIHQGVGSINVSDVILAEASGAIIFGFHVLCDERSKEEAEKTGVDIRTYNVIYELVNDLKTALEGMLEPKLKKIFLGRLIVRQVFKLSKGGTIAGCYVEKGKIMRSSKTSILRNGAVVYEGIVQSLKRFKDDVREVTEGMECGVSVAGFTEIMAGDIIEAYDIEKIARKL